MYTTASMIFKTLAEAGVTHAFVNWGNDHPAFLEELERERRASSDGTTAVAIVVCPHEIVALSTAQGYAQVTGRPAVVIVHVDVGTQVSVLVAGCVEARGLRVPRGADAGSHRGVCTTPSGLGLGA